MQINTIYTRSVIQTMAGKAIRDLRSGGERELRNVAELCKGCSASPGYQTFWSLLENILRRPDQQYAALLSRAANDVDINCLKTLIANLGLHAYPNGSQPLPGTRESGTSPSYWMEPLDDIMDPRMLHQQISRLQKQGTSSFLFRAGQKPELETILNIAGKHRQCVFFLICGAESCCRAYLEEMTALGNVIPLMEYETLAPTAASLKQAGILFGLHRRYCEIESLQAEENLLRQCIALGCFLGVYEGSAQCPSQNWELACYSRLQEMRCNGAQEIFLADLWRDREAVQKLLEQRSGQV
ncbi:hypothetical protein [Dysosmobacter sp.]|jgi:hypothetical protein|uniref:hypothetical protein n=1 Tax=Dysosmobacter sp. TaxID=2591382 RepID=UPI003D923241